MREGFSSRRTVLVECVALLVMAPVAVVSAAVAHMRGNLPDAVFAFTTLVAICLLAAAFRRHATPWTRAAVVTAIIALVVFMFGAMGVAYLWLRGRGVEVEWPFRVGAYTRRGRERTGTLPSDLGIEAAKALAGLLVYTVAGGWATRLRVRRSAP